MRSFLFAVVLVLPMVAGKAHAAAFCAYAGGWAGYENCGYHSFAQCLAAVGGRGGHCMRNPHDPALWGVPPDEEPNRRARRRR